MNEQMKPTRRICSYRGLLSLYSIVWILCLLFLHLAVCPEVARAYSQRLRDMGAADPALAALFAMPVIGNDPSLIAAERKGLLHIVIWACLYLSAALPVALVWAMRDDDKARWRWVYASIAHVLLFVTIAMLTTFGLMLPFFLV